MSVELPFVDEHRTTIAADREPVWAAVHRYATSLNLGGRSALGWVLGTQPPQGFEVAHEIPGQRVELAGRHRFSRYRLTFEVTDGEKGATTVTARTYAEFPGLAGRVYRALVIGSGGHAVAVRRMLRAISKASVR